MSTVTFLATSKLDPVQCSCFHMKPDLVLCNTIIWCIYSFQDTGIIQIGVVHVCSDLSTKKQTQVVKHDSLICASVLRITWCGTCLFKSSYVVCKLIVVIASHNAHATHTCATHMLTCIVKNMHNIKCLDLCLMEDWPTLTLGSESHGRGGAIWECICQQTGSCQWHTWQTDVMSYWKKITWKLECICQ